MDKILIIDDNDSFRESLAIRFRKGGFNIRDASSGVEGLEILGKEYFDLVITDLVMEEVDGLKVIEEVKNMSPATEVIMITAFATIDSAVRAVKSGAYDYITKEADIKEILHTVNRALEKKKLVDKLNAYENEIRDKYTFDGIIGKSSVMLEIMKTVSKVCMTDSTILITGKSGTGKELIGKAIHYNSLRKEKSLVILNCGALPESLHESELFGHRKGSFTGATEDKKGLIEAADKGTLILDEIGELSTAAQVKLLRFLQNGEIRRIGETRNMIVDVRVIAMTNRNLKKEIEEKNFREDLFYRLNVIPLYIAPLKEREDDIQLLIDYCIDKLRSKIHKPKLTISRRAIALLKNYSWPGNVRELENVLERCAILCDDDEIQPTDLPLEINMKEETKVDDNQDINLSMEELEKKHINRVLKQCKGNKTKTAQKLQISRGALQYKIKQYEIEEEQVV